MRIASARISSFVTAAALFCAAGSALAQELPSRESPAGYGVHAPSGTKVTATFDNGLDVDDYVFDGYPGATVKAKLKLAKGTSANATIELVRPDGTVVAADDPGANFKTGATVTALARFQVPDTLPPQFQDLAVGEVTLATKIKFTIDQVGPWKVRVRVPDLDVPADNSATYTLAIKYGSPPSDGAKSPDANEDGSFTFDFAARGGATLKFKFKFKGGDAQLSSIRAPNGTFVDAAGKTKSKSGKFVSGKDIEIPGNLPLGTYQISFDADPGLIAKKFVAKVSLPKSGAKLKGHLDGREPLFASDGLSTSIGGPGTQLVARIINAADANDPNGTPRLLLDNIPLENLTTQPGGGFTSVIAEVPRSLPQGTFDVVFETSTGQQAILEDAFTRVPPPVVTSIDPTVGTSAGGFEITITGANFPPNTIDLGVQIDGFIVPVRIISSSTEHVTFEAPSRAPTKVTFGVIDRRTQLFASLPINSFEYLSSPGISRIIPGLVPVLGGDQVFIRGTNFRDTDSVYIETATPGQFELIDVPTFQDETLHAFIAPVRPKGEYEIYVTDTQNVRTPGRRTISYFQFADFTTDLGLPGGGVGGTNSGWTTALADFDQDGDTDLFISMVGQGGRQSTSQTRILVNDGDGGLTDETLSRIQSPIGNDDWRADRIWVTDVSQDGYPDIVIVTNSTSVPAANSTHLRFLISERRGAQTNAADRVFRDRTADFAPPPRSAANGGVSNTSGDNWRGLDMWIGDIDQAFGPPEILITHMDLKEETNVFCGSYCNTSTTGGYTYSFYWGGGRAFVWDSKARGGQGRYDYEHNFFPRKAGVTVTIANPPPGVTIPTCTGGACRGKFTPFTGHTIVVGDINADRRPDVVVVASVPVSAFGQVTSSTQVALNGFNPTEGSLITDVTPKIQSLGGETKADAATIALLGYPDGNSFGTIVLTQATRPASGAAIRLIKFKPSIIEGDLGGFEDITQQSIPAVTADDAWQASAVTTTDADQDGDQDLVLLSNSAPSVGGSAFRVLRNVIENQQIGILRDEFGGLMAAVATASEPFDGDSLLVGDLDGDGANEYIVTRSTPVGTGSQTRSVTTDN